TIESVLTQTCKNFQFIIIDGGSTDQSVELIRQYQDKLAYWVSEKDKGVYNAMNKGLAQATGDFIFFLNAGEILSSENVLNEFAQFYHSNRDADIIYGNVLDIDEKGVIKRRKKVYLGKVTLFRQMICHQTIF